MIPEISSILGTLDNLERALGASGPESALRDGVELTHRELRTLLEALGVGEVKLSGQVRPDVREVVYGIDIKRAMRSKLVLGIADGWLEADGRRIYTTSDMRVGLFKPEA